MPFIREDLLNFFETNNIFSVESKTNSVTAPIINTPNSKTIKFFQNQFLNEQLETPTNKENSYSKFVSSLHSMHRKKWIEKFHFIDLAPLHTSSFIKYLTKNNLTKHLEFFYFLKEIKQNTDDEYQYYFKRFYTWLMYGYAAVLMPNWMDESVNLIEKFIKEIADIKQEAFVITIGNIYTKNLEEALNYLNPFLEPGLIPYLKPDFSLKHEAIFGGYFESTSRCYLMYEDGKIHDRISSNRQQFDPVMAMLSLNDKTL